MDVLNKYNIFKMFSNPFQAYKFHYKLNEKECVKEIQAMNKEEAIKSFFLSVVETGEYSSDMEIVKIEGGN